MMDLNKSLQTNNPIIKDEFNDLKIADQYIPLEDVYVENLYPFSNTTGYNHYHYTQHNHHNYHYQDTYSNTDTNRPFYDEFKENNSNNMNSNSNMTYYNNYSNNHYANETPQYPYTFDYHGYSTTYTQPNYYNLNMQKTESHEQTDTNYSQLIDNQSAQLQQPQRSGHLSNTNFLDSTINDSNGNVQIGEKPPEPYANIIVKAILSNNNNVMQLKDIYNYMIENYEYFSSQKQSTKWKNSVRHNLSRHKYFVKTCEKNAQGHYWSIDPTYLSIFKNGNFDEKSIKKAKLSSKFKNKVAKLNKKNKKLDALVNKCSTTNSNNNFDLCSSYVMNSSEISSPTLSCKSFNSSTLTNNDSAYLSSTEYPNSSFNQSLNNAENVSRPNLNLHDALSEIYMDSGMHNQHDLNSSGIKMIKKIKKEMLNY